MSVNVTRIRKVDSGQRDRYQKPIYRDELTVHTAYEFAPVVAGDVMGVDSIVSADGGTLYFREPNVTDAIPSDQFIVRGVTYDVDGREAFWVHPTHGIQGTVITLKREVFTDG